MEDCSIPFLIIAPSTFLPSLMSLVVVDLLPPVLFAISIDKFIASGNLIRLTLMAAAFMAVYIGSFSTTFSNNYLLGWLGGKLEYDMRMDIAHLCVYAHQ
jgi:ABC-type bacteriocin/lantibiotic exporter with double-glycine peptidase domain